MDLKSWLERRNPAEWERTGLTEVKSNSTSYFWVLRIWVCAAYAFEPALRTHARPPRRAAAAGPATVNPCTMYRNIRPVQCEHSPLSLPFFFYCTFEFGVLSWNGFWPLRNTYHPSKKIKKEVQTSWNFLAGALSWAKVVGAVSLEPNQIWDEYK